MPTDTPATPLVGRVDELKSLADTVGVGGAAHGAVLLGGDAGAGKSRLVRELTAQVLDDGWQVLIGHCLDFGDGSPPYLPFSEALGRLDSEDPATIASLVAEFPPIAGLLPAHRLMSDSATAPEPTQRAALYEAVHGALPRLSDGRSLLFVIEDVHWADQSTRDLLRFLFTRQYSSPIAILATYRSDDLHRQHPLRAALAEWVRLPSVTRLQLGPLPDDDARQLVHALHPAELPSNDLRQIVARAEGNPFFIEELVAAAEVSGGLLPADLSDLLLVRLEQLSDNGRRVVRAASVAGRRVSHALLASGTDLDPTSLEEAIRAAVEANILIPIGADGYAFRHALLGEAIYQDLLPGERVRLHAAYAHAIAKHEVEGSAAELSRHARASHDLVTATRASVDAGDEAMAVGGPEEALRHYELALELLADPSVEAGLEAQDTDGEPIGQVSLVIRASSAAAAAGHLFRAVSLAHAQLEALPDGAPSIDRANLIYALVTTALGIDNNLDVLALTTEAVRLLADDPPSKLQAQVLYVHARANADRARDSDAAKWASEALQIARDLKLAGVATDVQILLAKLDERSGDPLRAEAAISAAIAEARAAAAPLAELRGLYNLGILQYGQGRLSSAIKLFRECNERAAALGRQWAPYGLDSAIFGAIAAHVNGEWDLAASMVEDGQNPPELAEAFFAAIRLEIAAGRGNVEDLDNLQQIRDWWSLDGLVAITSGAAAIELLGQVGKYTAMQQLHDDIAEHVSTLWRRPGFQARVRLAALLLGHLATQAGVATYAERADLVARADQLAAGCVDIVVAGVHTGPELTAWADRVVAENARLRWQAGIDSPPLASLVEVWRQSVASMAAFGHVHETARSRARLAAVLLAAGDTASAEAEAGQAYEVAERLGAKPLLEELRAITGTPVAGPRGGADPEATLTRRERDVLSLVATGRSNREIGNQLFISAKTVSVHISNVLAKLDASSRTEAVAIARRRGLID
ncbi:MAG: AAA family ATPase [Frankiaceae bacterium]|nr:AAA family ATPase [Frankiaceae bacterium]MBV9869976.1 AAA family ATPase [Frankiaceae bacterium]